MTALSTLRLQPNGYQQFTSLGTAIQLGVTAPAVGATAIPSGSRKAIIYVEAAGIRWRDDGTAPTASVGMPVAAGSAFEYDGPLNGGSIGSPLQIIQQTSGAILNVMYYA